MPKYLFSLGLIPVQEWISEARRSRDLRAGSALLCQLMAKVLARLEAELKAKVLLPAPAAETSFQKLAKADFAEVLSGLYGIPNRASGSCEGDELVVARVFQSLQTEVLDAAWERFKDEFLAPSSPRNPWERDFWDRLRGPLDRYREATRGGTDGPVSIVWAARPFAGDEVRPQDLLAVDRLYAEIKRSRPVRPWTQHHRIGKCDQCARREAIGPTESFDRWREWFDGLKGLEWIEKERRLSQGERLCYVCLTKRMAGYAEGGKFPSTSRVALRGWVQAGKRRDPRLEEKLLQLERSERTDYDLGDLLRDPEQALEIKALIREVNRDHPKEPPLPESPPSYLALLTFDGDSMGRWVRRDPGPMSRRLASFADDAGRIGKSWEAAFFYLAGDEGLAMAPLAGALDLALELRQAFTATFGEPPGVPTLSMGIAVFEAGQPLGGAIRTARAVLESAKALEGKNALGVAVETASGSRWPFVAHWGEDWRRVRNAVRLIQDGKLSAGWAYDVERLLQSLPAGTWRRDGAADALREEVRRLFLRRLWVEGKTPEEKQANRRKAWEDLPGEKWWPADPQGRLLTPDPQQLHLIGFLSRQTAAAGEAGA